MILHARCGSIRVERCSTSNASITLRCDALLRELPGGRWCKMWGGQKRGGYVLILHWVNLRCLVILVLFLSKGVCTEQLKICLLKAGLAMSTDWGLVKIWYVRHSSVHINKQDGSSDQRTWGNRRTRSGWPMKDAVRPRIIPRIWISTDV